MPEALVLGVGAAATLTSAAILLGTFAYVALYALLSVSYTHLTLPTKA